MAAKGGGEGPQSPPWRPLAAGVDQRRHAGRGGSAVGRYDGLAGVDKRGKMPKGALAPGKLGRPAGGE